MGEKMSSQQKSRRSFLIDSVSGMGGLGRGQLPRHPCGRRVRARGGRSGGAGAERGGLTRSVSTPPELEPKLWLSLKGRITRRTFWLYFVAPIWAFALLAAGLDFAMGAAPTNVLAEAIRSNFGEAGLAFSAFSGPASNVAALIYTQPVYIAGDGRIREAPPRYQLLRLVLCGGLLHHCRFLGVFLDVRWIGLVHRHCVFGLFGGGSAQHRGVRRQGNRGAEHLRA